MECIGAFFGRSLAGFAAFDRIDTVPVGHGLLAVCRARVIQTHVLQRGHSVAFFAGQTLLARLCFAVRDGRRRALRAVGADVLTGDHGEPGRALDLVADCLALDGRVREALEAHFAAVAVELVPVDVLARRFQSFFHIGALFIFGVFFFELARGIAEQFVA